MTDKLVHTLIFSCRYRNHRNTKQCFHAVDIYGALISNHFIHHIQGNYHRDIHLQKLHRQIQISLNIRRIQNINDCFWLFIQHKIPGYDFFTAVRRHGINTRQIRHICLRMSFDRTILSVNRNTWKISYMLIRSGQLIKQSRFSAVLIAHQRIGQFCAFRQWIFIFFRMKLSGLTDARML